LPERQISDPLFSKIVCLPFVIQFVNILQKRKPPMKETRQALDLNDDISQDQTPFNFLLPHFYVDFAKT
jgi:hypothetical protein